jgi:hypothetical protein
MKIRDRVFASNDSNFMNSLNSGDGSAINWWFSKTPHDRIRESTRNFKKSDFKRKTKKEEFSEGCQAKRESKFKSKFKPIEKTKDKENIKLSDHKELEWTIPFIEKMAIQKENLPELPNPVVSFKSIKNEKKKRLKKCSEVESPSILPLKDFTQVKRNEKSKFQKLSILNKFKSARRQYEDLSINPNLSFLKNQTKIFSEEPIQSSSDDQIEPSSTEPSLTSTSSRSILTTDPSFYDPSDTESESLSEITPPSPKSNPTNSKNLTRLDGVSGQTYTVEAICDRRFEYRQWSYRVNWDGLGESERTWVNSRYLKNYKPALSNFGSTLRRWKKKMKQELMPKWLRDVSTGKIKEIKKKIFEEALKLTIESSRVFIDHLKSQNEFTKMFKRNAGFHFNRLSKLPSAGKFEWGDKPRRILSVIQSNDQPASDLSFKIDWHIRENGFKPYPSWYFGNEIKKYNTDVLIDFYESKMKLI